MTTLEELLKQVNEPQKWWSYVLDQCEKHILNNAHDIIQGGCVIFTYSQHVEKIYEQPLSIYLSAKLDAKVTVKYISDQRDGNFYQIKIERTNQ